MPELDPISLIKEDIKKTLQQFDVLSRQLDYTQAQGTHDSHSEPTLEVARLNQELTACYEQQKIVLADFQRIENEARHLIDENAEKHQKKIRKLYEKLGEHIMLKNDLAKKIDSIEAKMVAIAGPTSTRVMPVEDIKAQYSTTYEILNNFRQNVPDVYSEAEKETGIFFFTAPHQNL
jgi:chromosome segregation ATPase